VMSMEEIVTEIAERSDEEISFEELSDKLIDLSEHPLKINTATEDEWNQLFWLSSFQIENIKQYIKTTGPIASIYELVYIGGFTEKEIRLMTPFLSFEMPDKGLLLKTDHIIPYESHRVILRSQRVLEKQEGYKPENKESQSYFKGNRDHLYFRYTYQYGDKLTAGFTADKDPGEEFMSGSNKQGFDFNSFSLQVNKLSFIKTIIIGDYRVYFGQGLAVWSGVSFGKSSMVMSSMQRATGIVRYQSADENNFFRGVAVTFNMKPLETSLWYSSHPYDANITVKDSVTGRANEVSSFQTTGIHALPSEIADEDAVHSHVTGCNITYKATDFRAGITGLFYNYSATVNPDPATYNLFNFRGRSNNNLSFDFRFRHNHTLLFGEEATSQNGGIALLNGMQNTITSRLNFTLLSRYYQRNYQAMYGNAFGENARNSNEAGIFAGLECKLLKYTSLAGYIDVFSFPWLTYTADLPSSGRDFLMQITFEPSTDLQMYFQYRNKNKEENFSSADAVKGIMAQVQLEKLRYNLTYKVTERIQIKNRLELSRYKNEYTATQRGFYISQDIQLSPPKIKTNLYLRYAIFDADSYDSRIYAYENDLLYTFNIPAFYDKGTRFYILVKHSPIKNIDLWFKYAITRFQNKETIGTGPNEIKGVQKSDIKIQALMKF